jgi:glutamate synthase (NADPH/NADH) small chain
VAIIGAGPAGLGAADRLNRAGFSVVVYENAAKPGGILRYGIPDFKLEKWILDRRIQLMEDEGIVFETGVNVGTDISFRFLQGHFDAIVLTGGAREPRDLKVPGRDLKGIHQAMEFLVQQNKRLGGEPVEGEAISAENKSVVIIGGGDTGSDCLGTALRQGAKRVYQFEILPKPPPVRDERTPWPLWPNMLRESSSHKEGGERRWCVATKALVGEHGHVRRLSGVEVEWKARPEGGSPIPQEKPGTEFEVEADLVLLAMGFVGPGKNKLVEDLKLEVDRAGFIRRFDGNRTRIPGVFVAGDMTRGASLVVRAIADGREAGNGVIAFLSARRGEKRPDSK